MVLSILRVLPMARTAFILILFAMLTVAGASATQRHRSRPHHAATPAAGRTTAHPRAHRKASHAPRALPASRHAKHKAGQRSSVRTATARHPKPASSADAPRPAAPDNAPPAAPARSARLKSAPETGADRAIDPTTPGMQAATDPSGALTSKTHADEAPEPETEPDSVASETNRIESDAPSALSEVALRGTRVTPIAPLRGSMASLVRQNEKTDADHLERIENDEDLRDRIARGMLVPVPTSSALTINENLPADRRYCRPWTARFLTEIARAHATQFHRPIEVSSAVRTVDYQKRLIGVNGNAAAAEGDIVSPHVTGATVDIAKGGLSVREVYWMRSRLLALQNQGKLDVEEEFQQACFHITVYKSYAAPRSIQSKHRHPVATPVSAVGGSTTGSEEDTAGE